MEVPEEPQLPRARGARQQPRRAAIQERTQECMTEVMVPEVPRHAVPRQQPRRDAIQERTQECMTGVLTEVSASCEGPGQALKYLDTSVMAATLEGCSSRANSRINN